MRCSIVLRHARIQECGGSSYKDVWWVVYKSNVVIVHLALEHEQVCHKAWNSRLSFLEVLRDLFVFNI